MRVTMRHAADRRRKEEEGDNEEDEEEDEGDGEREYVFCLLSHDRTLLHGWGKSITRVVVKKINLC